MLYKRLEYPDLLFSKNHSIKWVGDHYTLWNTVEHKEESVIFKTLKSLKKYLEENENGDERNIS